MKTITTLVLSCYALLFTDCSGDKEINVNPLEGPPQWEPGFPKVAHGQLIY